MHFWKDLVNIDKRIFLHSREDIFSLFLIKSHALYIHDTFTSTRDETLASNSNPNLSKNSRKLANSLSYFQPVLSQSSHPFFLLNIPGVDPRRWTKPKHSRTCHPSLSVLVYFLNLFFLIHALLMVFDWLYDLRVSIRTGLMHNMWALTQKS